MGITLPVRLVLTERCLHTRGVTPEANAKPRLVPFTEGARQKEA